MIETIILEYLIGKLDVPVYMEVPEDPEGTFVVLEKTGSSRENYIDSATMAAQSYAPSMAQAAILNDQVKNAFYEMVELDEIGAVRLNSDYNFTNTTTKRYRYQAIFVVTY